MPGGVMHRRSVIAGGVSLAATAAVRADHLGSVEHFPVSEADWRDAEKVVDVKRYYRQF